MALVVFCLALWCLFALFGAYVSSQKRRPVAEGLILGFLFGPFGVLVAALLPTGDRMPPRDRRDDWDVPIVPSASSQLSGEALGFLDEPAPNRLHIVDVEAIRKADHRPRE